MQKRITASTLYDYIICPHKVYLDTFEDSKIKAPHNEFIELLWSKGTLYEQSVIKTLDRPFTDLSHFSGKEKEQKTIEAINANQELIYQGRLSHLNLVGEPDLLEKVGNKYVAIDIKSGAAEYGRDDHKTLKKHYAVQLALYTDILESKNLSAGRYAYVLDIHGEYVPYPLEDKLSIRSSLNWWGFYKKILREVESILSKQNTTRPALSSMCKLCQWYKPCKKTCIKDHDLTLVSELGRNIRDILIKKIPTIDELATIEISDYCKGHSHTSCFPGIGRTSLEQYQQRAELLVTPNAKPYLLKPVEFPQKERELFFDIEVDTMSDFTYLHGFVERKNSNTSSNKYISFWTEDISEKSEKKAFNDALNFMNTSDTVIYYYSAFEKTTYKKLARRYPEICKEDEVEHFFSQKHIIDLYNNIVLRNTEWPTYDKSIKTLAQYLGFKWRDSDPSGASSIEWFTKWKNSKDSEIKKRILEYNEDDCLATLALLDGLQSMPIVNRI